MKSIALTIALTLYAVIAKKQQISVEDQHKIDFIAFDFD